MVTGTKRKKVTRSIITQYVIHGVWNSNSCISKWNRILRQVYFIPIYSTSLLYLIAIQSLMLYFGSVHPYIYIFIFVQFFMLIFDRLCVSCALFTNLMFTNVSSAVNSYSYFAFGLKLRISYTSLWEVKLTCTISV